MKYIRIIFPFFITLLLWRLSTPFWNPAGILLMIPVFYFSFIKPIDWFPAFAGIFCFLLDYKSDTLLFWTSMYCLFYAANGLQQFVDLTRQKFDGALVFTGFFGISALILTMSGISFAGIMHTIWLILWAGILYIPFTTLSRKVMND